MTQCVRLSMWVSLGAMVAMSLGGCGVIADKDRIKIAKVDDAFITRGELYKVIREMPDDERPIIRNKGDMLRVLNDIINERLKTPVGAEVAARFKAEGQELVPRALAMQQYFQAHAEDDYASIYRITDPDVLGMSQGQLDAMKEQMEMGIDRIEERLLGDAALAFLAAEALRDGKMELKDEDLEAEYRMRKDALKKFEWMSFRAFRFPTDMPNAETEAANVRRRLDAGESFEALKEEFVKRDPSFIIESEIENNPSKDKFRGFWVNASGCEKGDIIGPVYLPPYQGVMGQDAQGRSIVKNMPATYMVLEVLEHRPERALTLDEAKPALLPNILVVMMMDKLREEHGVEIYEDKLPDPAMFSQGRRDPGF